MSSVQSNPPTGGGIRDLSKREVTLLNVGALLLGGWIIVWAASAANTITPIGIVIHHSSVIPGRPVAELDLENLDEFHKQRGFGAFYWGHTYHIGYHYIIFADGSVQPGRPEHCVGAHAKGHNSYLGIVLIGDFSRKHNGEENQAAPEPTAEQLRSLIILCRRLRYRYNIPLNRIVRHSDLSRTACPGDRFPYYKILQQIRDSDRFSLLPTMF